MSDMTFNPCPFCNSTPALIKDTGAETPIYSASRDYFDVVCKTQGCEIEGRAIFNKAWQMVSKDRDFTKEAIANNWV
ncbi:hypothetical protein ACMSWW_001138 [Cronobacter turicensis]